MSYVKPIYYNTLDPYIQIEHEGIQYTTCRDFNHISRYKGLRQIIHCPDTSRYISLETPNSISINDLDFDYYDVPKSEENRLDIIANKFLGSPQYSWVISYINDIEDGFTVREGQKIKIIRSFTDLFNKGEILATISALTLNLGSE